MTSWKTVKGFSKYKVSDDGKVLSFLSDKNGRLLNVCFGSEAYDKYSMKNDNGEFRIKAAHRLVAEAFIPNPDNLPQVNHINGIKKDNRVENLEWVTSSENHKHAYEKLEKESWAKSKTFKRKAKLSPTMVKVIRQTDIPIEELGELFGVNPATIYNARTRRTYKYLP